ncbi:MAG: hypothetical protein ACRDRA_10220 [Pseudonocardiaceae bacterium]
MAAAEQRKPTGHSDCWCCGKIFGEDKLVRLGEHPEVGVCLQCATWLKRRAIAHHHKQHPSPSGRLLSAIDTVRNKVIKRGWHDHPRLGPLLRGINRYLP